MDSEYLLQFFKYQHLPVHLQNVSKPFGDLARQMVNHLPANPERTEGLRKLLEAKDCMVRALLFESNLSAEGVSGEVFLTAEHKLVVTGGIITSITPR